MTVQPFSVPPDMEARGLKGAAVATRVLDKLTAMQAGINSIRAANTYANSWGDSVEVEIPQTGVSAGELWKFLRSWLGEEVKITGELLRTSEGLQLTARAGGSSPADHGHGRRARGHAEQGGGGNLRRDPALSLWNLSRPSGVGR